MHSGNIQATKSVTVCIIYVNSVCKLIQLFEAKHKVVCVKLPHFVFVTCCFPFSPPLLVNGPCITLHFISALKKNPVDLRAFCCMYIIY